MKLYGIKKLFTRLILNIVNGHLFDQDHVSGKCRRIYRQQAARSCQCR